MFSREISVVVKKYGNKIHTTTSFIIVYVTDRSSPDGPDNTSEDYERKTLQLDF